MELMEEEEILDVDINEFLKEDLALARKDLGSVATLKGSQVRAIVLFKQSFRYKNKHDNQSIISGPKRLLR